MTRHPALRFSLPGEWRSLPMGADEDLTLAVADFVRTHFGRRDDQATARAQQRARLGEAAARARDGGATQFHLSLTAPGNLAFASTVAEYRPVLPLGEAADPAVLADALVGVLGADSVPEASGDACWEVFSAAGGVVFAKDDGLVLRRDRRIEAADPDRDPPAAVVDYWLTEPGRARVVLVTFTTALAELAPLMIDLFDAIVGAAEWIAESGTAGLRAELSAEI